MGRSIYCSTCKKEKEPGRENESRCKKCKSDASKANRAKKRAEKGLPEYGSGRKKTCCDCGAIKENIKVGYCNSCHRKRDREWRVKTGRSKKNRTGKCQCGQPFASYSHTYCVDCATNQRREWLNRNKDKKKIMQDRAVAKRKENYKSVSKGRIRRKGTYINGEPVLCSECDKLIEGWCQTCDLIYWWRKEQYKGDSDYADKIKTRALTRSYIRSGKLIRQPCEVCGTNEKVEAHHDDYTKPLEVRWLCKKHHAEHHKQEKVDKL